MSFVDQLLKKHKAKLELSTTHNLTNELCEGTLPDHKLYTYLVQDLKFFQYGLRVMGNALACCDRPESIVTLGKQIGFFANNENTYFHTCLEQLRLESGAEMRQFAPKMLEEVPPTLPEVQSYLDVLSYLTSETRSYEEVITFIYVMEMVYLGWAEYHLGKAGNKVSQLEYKHKEWVDLHSGAGFSQWVQFLASEVDRVAGDAQLQAQIDRFFEKTLDLEIAFFDACYKYHEEA